jgi:transcriptional regulator with XRE-family HTH domain
MLDLPEFGRRLTVIRQALDLTQEQVADKLGAARSWISELERGRQRGLAAETVVRLCRALDCTSDYLLGLSDDPQPRRRRRLAKGEDPDKEEAA